MSLLQHELEDVLVSRVIRNRAASSFLTRSWSDLDTIMLLLETPVVCALSHCKRVISLDHAVASSCWQQCRLQAQVCWRELHTSWAG